MFNALKSFVLGSCFLTLFLSVTPFNEVFARGDRTWGYRGADRDEGDRSDWMDRPIDNELDNQKQYYEGPGFNDIGAEIYNGGYPNYNSSYNSNPKENQQEAGVLKTK